MNKICFVCSNPFNESHRHVVCCSQKCGKKFRQINFDHALEIRIGEPIGIWINHHYINNLWTYRQICNALNINTRTLMRYMRQFNITPRTPSEAVRTQWIRNPQRKLNSRNIVAKGAPKRAEYLRRHPQGCETALFNELTKRGIVFEFQYVVNSYILDFAFPLYHLDIELENPRRAGKNLDRLDKTKKRTAELQRLGWNCLYFRSDTNSILIVDTIESLII